MCRCLTGKLLPQCLTRRIWVRSFCFTEKRWDERGRRRHGRACGSAEAPLGGAVPDSKSNAFSHLDSTSERLSGHVTARGIRELLLQYGRASGDSEQRVSVSSQPRTPLRVGACRRHSKCPLCWPYSHTEEHLQAVISHRQRLYA